MSKTSESTRQDEILETPLTEDTFNELMEAEDEDEPTAGNEEEESTNLDEEIEEDDKAQKQLKKYGNPEQLAKAHASLQSEFTKRNQELAELRKQLAEKKMEEVKSLDYDSQSKYMLEEIARLQEKLETYEESQKSTTEEVQTLNDLKEAKQFVNSIPELKASGMGDIFIELANSPKYKTATFESIYKTVFEPKFRKSLGTKVRKVRNIVGGRSENVSLGADISDREYEKNRDKYLREAGFNI
jgi:predicted RNase H-like nuclease (RuvC/YqgF family)